MNPPMPVSFFFPEKTVQGEAGAEAAQAEDQESEASPVLNIEGDFR